MSELSESAGSGPRRTGAEGGDADADAPDRPKLVAVPEAQPDAAQLVEAASGGAGEPGPGTAASSGAGEPGPGTAASSAKVADADVARLELERMLNGPGASAPVRTADPSDPGAAIIPAAAPPTSAGAIPVSATPELVQALRSELAMRAAAEAGLRVRVVAAETRLAARVLLSQRTGETLRQVRVELDRLGTLLTEERERREAAERRVLELERELAADRGRSDDADRELATLRESLEQLRAPADDPDAGEPAAEAVDQAGEVRPERLADALTRLRAGTEPIDPVAGAAAAGMTSATLASLAPTATLATPFRTLCRHDPAVAGRLVISLLGMQRTAYPHSIAYDLLLGPGRGCIQVSSSGEATEVVHAPTARPLHQIDLQIAGDPERLARLLAAGSIRRRLRLGLARVRGNRDRLAALDALLALPLDLPALVAGGMLAEPTTLLSLVAAMVAPEWTRGARFVVGHRDRDAPPTYVLFADGRRPEVTPVAPPGAIATVIACAAGDLASLLAGSPARSPAAVEVLGETAALRQLQGWIKRAQSA